MEFLSALIAFVVISLILKWLVTYFTKLRKLPPGPWGIPFLGYVPLMRGNPHETLTKVGEKYGGMFTVNLFGESLLVLSDFSSIKECLVDNSTAFSGRPDHFMPAVFTNKKDVGTNDGLVWKKQRNLMMQCMKNVGVGKRSIESNVMDMVHDMIDQFKQKDGQVQSINSFFLEHLAQSTWKLISGDDIDGQNAMFKEFFELLQDVLGALKFNNPVNFFPWLRFVPPNGFGFPKIMEKNDKLLNYIRQLVEQRLKKGGELNLENFIDFYLEEIRKNPSGAPPYTMEHLALTLWDLFFAGVETTTTTLLWSFLYLANNPEVQSKAQQEMDRVIGRYRLPTMSDIPNLPYVESVIMEIHRVASLTPLAVPHSTIETVQVRGYTIPKRTTVLLNTYAVHKDPKLWKEPQSFNPERFLDHNGKARAPPYLIPFSIGARICVGQSHAELMLRLVISCLLHQFSFSLPPGLSRLSEEPIAKLSLIPRPFSLLIRSRI